LQIQIPLYTQISRVTVVLTIQYNITVIENKKMCTVKRNKKSETETELFPQVHTHWQVSFLSVRFYPLHSRGENEAEGEEGPRDQPKRGGGAPKYEELIKTVLLGKKKQPPILNSFYP